MENKKQQIKDIVGLAQGQNCAIKDILYIAIKARDNLRVVPIVLGEGEDSKKFEDLYTGDVYYSYNGVFSQMSAGTRLCDKYSFVYPSLKNANFHSLGNFIGVSGFINAYYQKQAEKELLKDEYNSITKQLNGYSYKTITTKEEIVDLAERIQDFFSGTPLTNKKQNTDKNENTDADVQIL